MSGVVLRCPNCGTTQGSPGECEACHEGEVRWFCPNHAPGRWLDGPACPDCGARVGRPPAAAPPPRRAPAAPRPPSSTGTRAPRPRRPAGDAWSEPPPPPAGRADRDDAIEVGRVEPPIGWPGARPPTIHVRPLPILGCIGRLVLWLVTAVVLLTMATCWFFGGDIVLGAAPAADRPALAAGGPPACGAPLVPGRVAA